jgi:hypothetical protein
MVLDIMAFMNLPTGMRELNWFKHRSPVLSTGAERLSALMRVSSRLFFRTACCSTFRIEKYNSVISGYILRAGDYKPRLGYKSLIVILSFLERDKSCLNP